LFGGKAGGAGRFTFEADRRTLESTSKRFSDRGDPLKAKSRPCFRCTAVAMRLPPLQSAFRGPRFDSSLFVQTASVGLIRAKAKS
jgi:hypothetical protein